MHPSSDTAAPKSERNLADLTELELADLSARTAGHDEARDEHADRERTDAARRGSSITIPEIQVSQATALRRDVLSPADSKPESSPRLHHRKPASEARLRTPATGTPAGRVGSLFVLGAGVVGSEVLEQVSALPEQRRPPFVGLRVVGVATRRGGAFDVRGIEPSAIPELVANRRAQAGAAPAVNILELPARATQLDALARLSDTVLVDCTAADGMEEVYEEALARGIHVVTANKKPLVASREKVDRVFAAAARSGASFRYEATVGAGLPVIGTLQGLVRTGDRIRSIECALSGTLGFITNELARGIPLSTAVATAKARGYTEPDPREDLAGTDVARKAVILARELGIPLELEHVSLSPLVPQAALDEPDLDAALKKLDGEFSARMDELKARGEKLVYLARIIVEGTEDAYRAEVVVGPQAVAANHPAYSLEGPTGLVAFTTDRYPETPLVVRGSGAGGAVTASAVLSDTFLCLSGQPEARKTLA